MRFVLMLLMATAAPLAFAATPAAGPPSQPPDDSPDSCFTGYAYHLASGEFAYTEHHRQWLKDGNLVYWKVTYRAPGGDVIARKTLAFPVSDYVPVYEMTILASGYMEGIRHDESGWRMVLRKREGAALQTQAFELEPPMAGDSGFHPYVQARFSDLMAGDTVEFKFVVSGRQSVVDMQAFRIDDTTFEGEPAVQFRAELDMFLVNWFVDPLELVYDPDSKRLLEYRGIGNMHNAKGEAYPVRVSYYTEVPPEAKGIAEYVGACGATPQGS